MENPFEALAAQTPPVAEDDNPFAALAARERSTSTSPEVNPFEALARQASPEANPFEALARAPSSQSGTPAPAGPDTAGAFTRYVKDPFAEAVAAVPPYVGQGIDAFQAMQQRMAERIARLMGHNVPEDQPAPSQQSGTQIGEAGQKLIRDTMQSPGAARRREQSEITGTLWEPSTWSGGTAPSIDGWLLHGAGVLGQLAPVVATTILTRGSLLAGGTVGGAAGAGAALKEANDAVDQMLRQGTIAEQSSEYRRYIAEGKTHEQAVALVRRESENWAMALATPMATAGGAATSYIAKPGSKLLAGAAFTPRLAGRAAIGAAEEGFQEVGEGIATRAGINVGAGTNIPLGQNTFGEFVLGAFGGGVMGAATTGRRAPPTRSPENTTNETDLVRGTVDTVASEEPSSIQAADQVPNGELVTITERTTAAPPAEPAPVFYSQVRKLVEEKGPNTATPEQWAKTIQNWMQQGVKAEEIEWLQLPAYLTEGKGPISKRDLLTHIDEHQIKVETIERTAPALPPLNWEQLPGPSGMEAQRTWTAGEYDIDESNGQYHVYYTPYGSEVSETLTPPLGVKTLHWAQNYVQAHRSTQAGERQNSPRARHAGYQLEGETEGYSELVLRWDRPRSEVKAAQAAHRAALEEANRFGEAIRIKYSNNVPSALRTKEDSLLAEVNRTRAALDVEVQRLQNTFRDSSHWDETDVLAWARVSRRKDAEGKLVLYVEEVQSQWHQLGRKFGYQGESLPTTKGSSWTQVDTTSDAMVPNAPFKGQAWVNLAVKRILRYAADNSIERVAFSNGTVQARRWAASPESPRGKGLIAFYERMIPNVVGYWARKLGGTTGLTQIPTTDPTAANGQEPAFFIDITPQMASRVQQGLTTFQRTIATTDSSAQVNVTAEPKAPGDLVAAADRIGDVVLQLAQRFGIKKPITIEVVEGLRKGEEDEGDLGSVTSQIRRAPGDTRTTAQIRDAGEAVSYHIKLYPDKQPTAEAVAAAAMHELGHIITYEHYSKAPADVQLALEADHQNWRRNSDNLRFKDLLALRYNFLHTYYNFSKASDVDTTSTVPNVDYFLSFSEYMAEGVSRYLLTNEKPQSVVDRFFSALARKIRELRNTFAKAFGGKLGEELTQPQKTLEAWLDSLITLQPLDYAALQRARDERTRQENQKAMEADGHPDFPATPQTVETGLPRRLLKALGLWGHPGARSMVAAADRFNVFYKYMLSVIQVAARNPHIPALRRYVELWQQKQLERATMMNEALTTQKAWARLRREQSDNLAKMMDDYAHGRFMTPAEQTAGVRRRPTAAEYAMLFKKYGVEADAQAVFRRVQEDFDRILARVRALEEADAQAIRDPGVQTRTMAQIAVKYAGYANIPYMPFMRYGQYSLTIRDSAGNLVAFYAFESERARRAGRAAIAPALASGETMKEGFIGEELRPYMGLPPGLLKKIEEKLGMTPQVKAMLQELQYELSPSRSFGHRFQKRTGTPGYSLDFQRGYLNYFFFGSNFLVNAKYSQPLLDQIKEVKDSARPLDQGTRRGRIAEFLSNHYHFTMNPTADWAKFRQAATLMALGGSLAAATLNLSQMVVGSYPHLAGKFGGLGVGDVRASKALLAAGASLSTYYKRGTLEAKASSDALMRALNEGVKEGIITEALAHELAAAAEADNLKPYALTRAKEIWNFALDKSMWMFSMTEQMNRRITFRAAWQLALDHPNMPYVQEAVAKHQLAYDNLIGKGWSPREAAAFVVAKDSVEETQFIYSQWANPRFMRGGLARTLFIFKSFQQNTLFFLWNNKDARLRALLVMAFLGGAMGMPGGEDLRGIAKALAWRLFGKDFDIEEEGRRFVLDVLNGVIPPDLVMHGAARRGFGLSAMLDLLGVPFPTFDRSKAVSMGTISPVDFGVLFGPPNRDNSRAIAESTQKAAGAAFGLGFNLYKFLTDSQLSWTDSKRWQQALPRAAQGATRAYRYYTQGEEVNRFGNRVVRFDTDDPRHLGEIIGAALGYQPARLAAQWDRIMAEREAITFWNIRREMLLRQLWTARRSGDEENYARVLQSIRNFNTTLPRNAALKAISADTIRRSFETRGRAAVAQERGTPRTQADIPIVREIQRLYPEAQVDVRTVR